MRWLMTVILSMIPVFSQSLGKATGSTGLVVLSENYQIGIGDVLDIKIADRPDVSGERAVLPRGTILLFKLDGELHVDGLSPQKVEQMLREKYLPIVGDHPVHVGVKDYRSKVASVLGAVNKPSDILLLKPTKVTDALLMVGGLANGAKRKNICVWRTQETGRSCISFDYGAVAKGRNLDQDIELKPGDTIVVLR